MASQLQAKQFKSNDRKMNGKNIMWTGFHPKHSWSLGKKSEYLSAMHLPVMTFLKKLVTLGQMPALLHALLRLFTVDSLQKSQDFPTERRTQLIKAFIGWVFPSRRGGRFLFESGAFALFLFAFAGKKIRKRRGGLLSTLCQNRMAVFQTLGEKKSGYRLTFQIYIPAFQVYERKRLRGKGGKACQKYGNY